MTQNSDTPEDIAFAKGLLGANAKEVQERLAYLALALGEMTPEEFLDLFGHPPHPELLIPPEELDPPTDSEDL
jgi:hypothetical protein